MLYVSCFIYRFERKKLIKFCTEIFLFSRTSRILLSRKTKKKNDSTCRNAENKLSRNKLRRKYRRKERVSQREEHTYNKNMSTCYSLFVVLRHTSGFVA